MVRNSWAVDSTSERLAAVERAADGTSRATSGTGGADSAESRRGPERTGGGATARVRKIVPSNDAFVERRIDGRPAGGSGAMAAPDATALAGAGPEPLSSSVRLGSWVCLGSSVWPGSSVRLSWAAALAGAESVRAESVCAVMPGAHGRGRTIGGGTPGPLLLAMRRPGVGLVCRRTPGDGLVCWREPDVPLVAVRMPEVVPVVCWREPDVPLVAVRMPDVVPLVVGRRPDVAASGPPMPAAPPAAVAGEITSTSPKPLARPRSAATPWSATRRIVSRSGIARRDKRSDASVIGYRARVTVSAEAAWRETRSTGCEPTGVPSVTRASVSDARYAVAPDARWLRVPASPSPAALVGLVGVGAVLVTAVVALGTAVVALGTALAVPDVALATPDAGLAVVGAVLSAERRTRPVAFGSVVLGVIGCPLAVIGCPLAVIGCPLAVIGCPLAVIGCPLAVSRDAAARVAFGPTDPAVADAATDRGDSAAGVRCCATTGRA